MIKCVAVSDTHNMTDYINMPSGDIFFQSGDFTYNGTLEEVEHYNKWLGTLDFKYKIVIAGNHEIAARLNGEEVD